MIDPKRHYKKGDSRLNTFPNIFSGNVCEVWLNQALLINAIIIVVIIIIFINCG